MPRLAYVNGAYVPLSMARVSVEDRGFQFADGVYEVIAVAGGQLVDDGPHLDRLAYSLGELKISWPVSRTVIPLIMKTLIDRNRLTHGSIYMQITRGVAHRNFAFPAEDTHSTLVMTTTRLSHFGPASANIDGVRIITVPDIRWQRRDIKTVALLAQVLAKQQAIDAGAYEAWQVDPDGTITEGASSNAWIVTGNNTVVTRPASYRILNGITRIRVLGLAAATCGLQVEERPFTPEDVLGAQEAFLTSATSFVVPVTSMDGHRIGNGLPGDVTRSLREAYRRHFRDAF